MKGFLLDENLPSRLQCSPTLPVIAFSQVSRSRLMFLIFAGTLSSGNVVCALTLVNRPARLTA